MPRCLLLVPLLVTQSLTTVPQGISSLEAPAEPVKVMENGLALIQHVLVSYVLNKWYVASVCTCSEL